VLARLGIETIGQLAALPRSGWTSRLGPEPLLRWNQALGAADETIDAVAPRNDFAVEWTLEHPTDRREMIEAVIEALVERLATQLATAGQGALRLVWRLQGEFG
jgi:protein ImuB